MKANPFFAAESPNDTDGEKRLFGGLLREWRSNCGYTMGDLAEQLQVTVTFVSDLERAFASPPRWTPAGVAMLSEYLCVDAEWVVKLTVRTRAAWGLGGAVPAD